MWGVAEIAAGLMTTGMVPPPDILLNNDARYMAVRAADAGLMVTSTLSNYTVVSWLRHDGLDRALPWPKPGEVSADGSMRCNSLGCIATVNGVEVAFVQDERAFAEDCARTQIVIAAVPAFNQCPADVVVDRFDV